MPRLLTKSAFLRGYDCPARIRHVRGNASTPAEADAFVTMLADGGFRFEEVVRQTFGGKSDPEPADRDAASIDFNVAALHHEIAFTADGLHARADMIRTGPSGLEVFEIKSSTIDGTSGGDPTALLSADHADAKGRPQLADSKGRPRTAYLKYIVDAAFQTIVIERHLRDRGLAIPVLPRLVLINRLGRPDHFDLFENVEVRTAPEARTTSTRFRLPPPEKWRSSLVCAFDVMDLVKSLREHDGRSRAIRWAGHGLDHIVDDARALWLDEQGPIVDLAKPERGWKCRDCEFRPAPTEGQSAFSQCWPDESGSLEELLTLHRGDRHAQPGARPDGRWVDELATTKPPVRLTDLTITGRGEIAERQRRQQRSIERGQLVVDDPIALKASLVPRQQGSVFWFLDFETICSALPHFPDLGAYENFIFQYSLHGLAVDLDTAGILDTVHADWLFTEVPDAKSVDEVDRAMLAALSKHLELPVGTRAPSPTSPIFHWAPHERTMLNATRTRLARTSGLDSGSRLAILDSILGAATTPASSRLIDMCDLAQKHVAHPSFEGSYSIKKILPAAMTHDSTRDLIESLVPEIAGTSRQHASPYEGLAARTDGEHRIADGTAAMAAFNALRQKPPTPDADQIEAALKVYCRLDTTAMAAVWSWLVKQSRA